MLAKMKVDIALKADTLKQEQRRLEGKLRRAVFKSMLPIPARNATGRPSTAPVGRRPAATAAAPAAAAAAASSSLSTSSSTTTAVKMDAVVTVVVDARWAEVVLNTNVMKFVGWQALGRFRSVSKVRVRLPICCAVAL